MLAKLFRDFMLIWTTVDPIGNLALFAGLTAALTRAERRRVARRATIYAAIILVGAVVLGQIILDAMGIHLLSLKLAGGIILFLFSLQMLFGNMENSAAPEPTRAATSPSSRSPCPRSPAPEPSWPSSSRPTTTSTPCPSRPRRPSSCSSFSLLTYGLFLLSEAILKVIGRQGASILVRVMGILLASLSVELVMNALGDRLWASPAEAVAAEFQAPALATTHI